MIEFTRTYLSISGFHIYWYSVLIAIGVCLAIVVSSAREKEFGLPSGITYDIVLICLPIGIIGARAYYVLMRLKDFNTFYDVINIRGGGLAIYGGLIAGISAGAVFARVKKLSFVTLLDLAAPGIALAQAVGRWGNFLNQEAYGIPVTEAAFQSFPFAVYIEPEKAWFCATFFYESLACLLTALFILFTHRKRFARVKGSPSLVYLTLYCCERVVVEGLRTDSLYIGAFRVSQLLSAFVLIFVILYLYTTVFTRKALPACVLSILLLLIGILISELWIVFAGSVCALCVCCFGITRRQHKKFTVIC